MDQTRADKKILTDSELIQFFLETRNSTFYDELYCRYSEKVFKHCNKIVNDPYLAQDIKQDVFITLFNNIEKFNEKSAFSTWLYSITFNQCMNQLRIVSKRKTIDFEFLVTLNYHTTEDLIKEYEELHEIPKKLINSLPLGELVLIKLKYQEGFTITELSKYFNITPSAVKMRLKRTRDSLRKKLTICKP